MSNAMTYKVRSGTIDLGRKYECKMAALFALKFALKDGEMWMASNAPDVGAFDDIVIHHAGDTYLLQLKHKENSKAILEQELLSPRGDFALAKYFKDVAELKRNLISNNKSKFQNYLGEFSAIHFIIFTNRSISQSKFLEEIVKTNVNFLNCKHDGTVHRINANELPFAMDDPKNYSKVFAISNQMDAKHLDSLILQEIKNVFNYYQLMIYDDDIEKVAETFTNFIQNWAEGYAGRHFHYCLTKTEVLQKLSEIMLSKYEATFINAPFVPYIGPNQLIWNNIVKSKKFTVTKYSEAVFDFLLKYFAYEVNKHCSLGNTLSSWSGDLPDTLRNVFYQNCGQLRTQMIKITKHLDTLKPVDIYRCLWTIAKIPVLLEVTTSRHLNDVQLILQMSNNYYNVLILNKCDESYTSQCVGKNQKRASFFSLEDVNQTDKDSILRINVSFQGRGPTALGSLITENMFRHITCENIISILSGNFNIGNKPTPLTDYFIERKVSRIFIKSQAFDKVEREKFVIGGNWEEDLNATLIAKNVDKRRTYDAFSAQNRIKIGFEIDSIEKHIDKPTSPPIHHLVPYRENLFEWKCSIGSVSSIKPFVVELENVTESDIVSKLSSKVTLLCGAPGMGKSVLLDSLAHRIPASRWVIKVNLNPHMHYFMKLKEESLMNHTPDHLKYFHDFYTSHGNKNLSDAIFNKLRSSRDVIVMLDGFDEISLQYKEEVVDIAISLCNEGCRVCITTRPHMQEYLEDTFGTFSIGLKSFSENDQIEFLRKYFSGTSHLDSESQQCISHFVENLLQATKSNLVDLDAEFTGIPLQTYLLAAAFQDDCRRTLLQKKPKDFNQTLDLIYLFRSFINKKIEILASKNGYPVERGRILFKRPQEVVALKLLFPSHCDVIEHIEEQPGYSRLDRELLQEGGIVTVDKHSNINFIHRSFGEYLAAQWLSENFNSQNEEIKKVAKVLIQERFYQNHKFLFILFDRILAENCPLHLDVINNKMSRVIDALNMNIERVLVTDKCKRSVLHMLALYGTRYPPFYNIYTHLSKVSDILSSYTFEAEKTLDIVSDIFRHITIATPNLDQLGYSPLDYALENYCLGIADKLCCFWKQLPLQVHVRMKIIDGDLAYYAWQKLKRLFNFFSVHVLYKKLLLNTANGEEKIEHYYQRTFSRYVVRHQIDKYIADFKNETIWQFLLEKGSEIIPSLRNLDTDIHMATIFGPKEKASWLILHSNDINKDDGDYSNTVLHYAILHNKTDLIKQILKSEVDVNRSNIDQDTPLHFAVQQSDKDKGTKTIIKKMKEFSKAAIDIKHKKIVKMLLSNGAQINVQNNDGDTPLHLALENRNLHIAKLLISKGADVDITNKLGASCLHLAAYYGYNDVLRYLSSFKMDTNSQTNLKQTPLILAVANNHFSSVKTLLSYGADVNTPCSLGQTCLHIAAINGDKDIVNELISCTDIDIDRRDRFGWTPLTRAVDTEKHDIVSLLTSRGASINMRDNVNKTYLHLAPIWSYSRCMHRFLLLSTPGYLVDLQDNCGNTALSYAEFNQILGIVNLHWAKYVE